MPHLDEQQFNELRELMADDFGTLIEAYLRDSSERLQLLTQACAEQDLASAKRQAHSLKGSSSNVGAATLAEHCQRLEQLARGGEVAAVLAELSALQQELANVQLELRRHLA
ncbi:Hpt domain-containing protein [Permianibacter sp. IMCC34836]|uniref:Hpt domain-containing protein n=1 Tax=Permianibacter fluminis TaxID=2738515 RepID=UPI001556E09B|nr:Hpt domain-containing protein [Permianibacter fluminis]NQD38032.1 Hpt domain-containing protein [Permianibacter fluminis]